MSGVHNSSIVFLDVPFEERYEATRLGAKYDKAKKTWYAPVGEVKKDLIERYASPDFSLQRWFEDDLNKMRRPFIPGKVKYVPRPHQKVAGTAILKAWEQGNQGFLLGDGTGVGKSLGALKGACEIAKAMRRSPIKPLNLLIVCPKAVIPSWRNTLRAYGDTVFLRPLIINYQQLNKLIKAPKTAKDAKTKRTKNRRIARSGSPLIRFDVIIFDEEQYLKNYGTSAVSMAANTIAQTGSPYIKGKSPFVISVTATPGTNPLELAMMAPWLSTLVDARSSKYTSPSLWGAFLGAHHFHVKKGKSGWSWSRAPWGASDDPKAQESINKEHREDTERIGKALSSPRAPYLARNPSDIAGWPEQQVEPFPLALTNEQKIEYMLAWNEFRKKMRLAQAKKDTKSPLVEALRFSQKTSLLKAEGTAAFVEELVNADKQVFIGIRFKDTALVIEEYLRKHHIAYSEYFGSTEDRESEKLRFQKGETKVILCSVVAGVSFQAGEMLPDGTKATSNDRITIIADVRDAALDTYQQMGRCHRDGVNSLCYVTYADGTRDERTITAYTTKIRNMKSMTADNDRNYLARVLSGMSNNS